MTRPEPDPAMTARLEAALHSGDPRQALREIVLELAAAGMQRAAAYEMFADFYGQLREQGRQNDEDLVGDVMDMITGGFAPFNIDFPAG
jgi:hypothetical protein